MVKYRKRGREFLGSIPTSIVKCPLVRYFKLSLVLVNLYAVVAPSRHVCKNGG